MNFSDLRRSPFIDKKGYLFGRWDIFKPLFVIVILTLSTLTLRVLLQKDTYIVAELWASGGEWWWNNPDPPYWLADPIQVGSIEYDPQGDRLVEILEVRKFEIGERKRLWMKVKLKVTPSGKSQQYRFRREPLQIGKVIQISPNNVNVNVNVIAIEGVGRAGEQVEKLVTLRLYGIFPWHAEAMKVGSKMVDSNNDVLAEIVGSETSFSQEFVNDAQGVGHVVRNPLKNDAVIKIKVRAQRFEEIDYFAEFQPLKVGFFILFPFDNVNVEGYISEIGSIEE